MKPPQSRADAARFSRCRGPSPETAHEPDFLLKKEQLVVEVKRTRATLGARQVGEELIVDIRRYAEHPDCKTLVCFVYDPEGRVKNPRAIEGDLEKLSTGAMAVRIFVRPR